VQIDPILLPWRRFPVSAVRNLNDSGDPGAAPHCTRKKQPGNPSNANFIINNQLVKLCVFRLAAAQQNSF
jgi:hypothetical protein